MSEDPGDRANDRHRPGVAHAPLRAAVSEELRRAIVEGRYRPGERLLEDQIAHDLDVSRAATVSAAEFLT